MAFLSDLASADAEALVGKQVSRVEAREYALVLHFNDGAVLTVRGATCDGDSALGVELEHG